MRLALGLLVLLAATSATAETRTLADARVKLDPPDGWKLEQKGNLITMLEPNEEASFILQVADAPKQEPMLKAAQSADAFLSKFATDVKWAGRPRERTANGMKTLSNDARVKVGGKPALVKLVVWQTPVDKLLTFIGVIDASKEKVYAPVATRFLESVKPI